MDKLDAGAPAKTVWDELQVIRQNRRKPLILPHDQYNLVVIDPPYAYTDAPIAEPYKMRMNYRVMLLRQIQEINFDRFMARNSVLLCWVTNAYIPAISELLAAWKYEFRSLLIWDKGSPKLGKPFRHQAEFVVYATRGRPPRYSHDPKRTDIFKGVEQLDDPELFEGTELFKGKFRGHSVKPDEFYEMVERLFPDTKRLEMFARRDRKGWTTWGLEVIMRENLPPALLDWSVIAAKENRVITCSN